MNILHVTHSIDPAAGGTVEFITQCSLAMMDQGHHAEVVSLDDPNSAFIRNAALPTHAFGPGFLGYGYCSKLVPWLRKHASSYDAVIVHGLWQYSGLGVWRALRKSSTPYFVFPHGMLDPWFNRTYPAKHAKKIPYWWLAERRVLRDARAVLFTCDEEGLLAQQSFSGYRCNEVTVNFGTRDPQGDRAAQKAAFIERFPELSGKRYLLFLGRIEEKKGCDLLIQAFAEAARHDPQVLLVMAGPDRTGWRASLEALAERAGIAQKILWTGMLMGDEKWGAISGAEAFVLPSHQENFGIAVAESLACSVPVLISNKVNIWRGIQEDGAGLVADDTLDGVSAMLSD